MARKREVTMDEFGIAESLGEIQTMPEINEEVVAQKGEEIEIIDNPEQFRMAIGHAQMAGDEYLEVGPKLFKYLLKNSKSKYLTYGDPGIKVYLQGTREKYEREDKMTAEAYAEYEAKERAAGNV